jgi:hypothetical protein
VVFTGRPPVICLCSRHYFALLLRQFCTDGFKDYLALRTPNKKTHMQCFCCIGANKYFLQWPIVISWSCSLAVVWFLCCAVNLEHLKSLPKFIWQILCLANF